MKKICGIVLIISLIICVLSILIYGILLLLTSWSLLKVTSIINLISDILFITGWISGILSIVLFIVLKKHFE